MNDQEREELNERSNSLRTELKAWEKSFAAANDGKKASREDIKQNPDIAAKYKEYNKSRDVLSGKIPFTKAAPVPASQTPRKRRHAGDHGVSKRQQISKTPSKPPSKGTIRPWEVDPYESPSVIRNLFTPSKKVLGPTPQKDGVVLGMFDLLQESTPSKTGEGKEEGKDVPINATPRKAKDPTHTGQYSKTPSTARRILLDGFATPLKNRESNNQGGKTPSSVSNFHFATPSFLRRDSQRIHLPPVNENEAMHELSPQMVRVPRKPLVRGLSSILASLRKMEEDAADEDLEALHEMEAEEAGPPKPKPAAKPKKQDILVADSQPGFPLGGFDDEAMYDSAPEEKDQGLGPDGKPLKVYKKKGQKRTTRRVKMKPTRSAPSAPIAEEEEDDELAGEGPEAIPETQIEEATFDGTGNFDSDTQSEYTASEGGTRYRRPNQAKKNKSLNKDGKIKTAARKVNAMAHQNFKRLKLRNSGAKGGVAHNSRFRRKK